MASGFIILSDGRCLSVRYPTHDALLQSVAASLEEGSPLREWLITQIPGDADIEMGYGFVRIADGQIIVRHLDLRGLTEVNRKLFESAARQVEPIAGPYAPVEDVTFALDRFRAMLDRCERGEPPLGLSDWTCEAPPVEERIGPGWGSPA